MSTLPIVPPRFPGLRRTTVVAAAAVLSALPLVLVLSVVERAAHAPADAACTGYHAERFAYGPADVVELQVDALRANAALGDDRGIQVAWRLASAANRAYTGPFPRFAAMVKAPLYAPLLDHDGARFGPVDINGDVAQQRVVVERDGAWLAYRWTLSLAPDGSWRTDAVLPEPLE